MISVEKLIHAPVQKVWSAITDKNEMKAWYFDLASFKAEPGFEFNFTGGPPDGIQYLHQCRITEVEINKKLSYSWSYAGYTGISFVSFEIIPQGENTLVVLTHSGVETFPADNPDFAKQNFIAGWNDIIGRSLPGYLENAN